MASVWVGTAVVTTLTVYIRASIGKNGIAIGGDFMAFYAAAKASLAGSAIEIYDRAHFHSLLAQLFPAREFPFSLHYPPTFLLLVAPFAVLPYLAAFAVWSICFAAGYFLIMRRHVRDPLVLFAIFASPSAYVAFVTGQTGFVTAILISLAVVYPKTRPTLAGVAGGLLTIKPQLGLLIPVAFVAASCWRAFFTAAVTVMVLVAISLVAFGAEAWRAFFGSLHQSAVALDGLNLQMGKTATLYSAVLSIGLPATLAKAIYLICVGLSAWMVWRIWRKAVEPMLLAGGLIACVFITSPYGFYYDLIMLALPLAMVAEHAVRTGWLSHERWMVVAAVISPLSVNQFFSGEVSISFATVLLVFVVTMRRIRHEVPEIFHSTRKSPKS